MGVLLLGSVILLPAGPAVDTMSLVHYTSCQRRGPGRSVPGCSQRLQSDCAFASAPVLVSCTGRYGEWWRVIICTVIIFCLARATSLGVQSILDDAGRTAVVAPSSLLKSTGAI
jgi:hypothetical protein